MSSLNCMAPSYAVQKAVHFVPEKMMVYLDILQNCSLHKLFLLCAFAHVWLSLQF